jgi:hypothetical protein
MGRGIACLSGRQVLPFSKTQPVFCFLCAAGLRRLPCGKRWAFLSFGLQKKKSLADAQHVLFYSWWVPPRIRKISYLMKICFCLWQRLFDTFSLMKKYPNAEAPLR